MIFSRDGRFKLGDEIINVNGKSLRGHTVEEARNLLRTSGPDMDIILAREPETQQLPQQPEVNETPTKQQPSYNHAPGPVERRRRRKLPSIERPRSAPIHNIMPQVSKI